MQKFISESGVDEIIQRKENGCFALIGNKCAVCGHIMFPALKTCIKCGSEDLSKTELAKYGTLYTWTRTMRPVNHMPAGAITGYIDLDDGVRVFAPIDWPENDKPLIGTRMEILFRPLWTEENGTEVLGYAARQSKEATA